MMNSRERRTSDRLRGVAANILLGSAAIVVVGLVAFPMFVPRGQPTSWAVCQSNMNQIGKAIQTYLTDWDGRYPTNRRRLSNGELGPVSTSVMLSCAGIDPGSGKPCRFEHGVTWVEGLYSYVEPITTQDDKDCVWKCPTAARFDLKPTSDSAAVTYVFNRNLIEKPEKVVRYASNLMLVREMNCLVDSELRPINDSCTKDRRPVGALPNDHALHGNGSNVLCADYHVKHLDRDSQSTSTWDPKTKTWGNVDGSITVSP